MPKPVDSQNKTRPHKAKTPRKSLTHEPAMSIDTVPTRAPGYRRPFVGFDRERTVFGRLKPELLASSRGRYVVLVGDEVVGPLDSHEEAERAGYIQFGLGPLYIKQIVDEEPVVEVTWFYSE